MVHKTPWVCNRAYVGMGLNFLVGIVVVVVVVVVAVLVLVLVLLHHIQMVVVKNVQILPVVLDPKKSNIY